MPASTYWIVSAPNESLAMGGSAFERMRDKLERQLRLCATSKLSIPTFRVGTLDGLVSVSDAVNKEEKAVEVLVDRILRQYRELRAEFLGGRSNTTDAGSEAVPQVEGLTIDDYVARFEWDEARFSSSDAIKEVKDAILSNIARLEEDLKIRSTDYSSLRQAIGAIERRAQGSLMTRSLTGIVKAADVLETDHLTTALVVMQKLSEPEFLSCYETLGALVVPRSAKKISQDGDYVLYAVTVFKKGMDEFKSACRDKRITVREFAYDPDAAERDDEDLARLRREMDDQEGSFRIWSETAFSEAFVALVHIKVIRTFVESVLRYGLPLNFEAAVLKPAAKTHARIRASLADMFMHLGGSWVNDKDDSEVPAVAGLSTEKDFYPYVFLEIPTPI
eukprot:CAMPEP_0184679612 /NCGR_PEP_ID=MMETSP0312-20130426/2455_1 /TAXON_ID=31354 /ORGANISM="Compsopogon coeruleus, Strain SAG 36.94" /LENGTH=390 /DNA_ID=CAMNT_0027129165 /DNA_START=52 /DNA_END=1224 /DNA_ORIENTATION=+